MKLQKLPRTGIGFDAHRIEPGKPCMIACLSFPADDGCEGHSDGDLVAHALVDALVSASHLGDLGSFVGVDLPETKGISGTALLKAARAKLEQEGVTIGNVACQLVGQTPKMGPRRAEAEAAIEKILGCPVSISATTTDHMGFTGSGEGRAAVATALVY